MSVPYVFANAVGSIPLSELDANFAQVAVYSNTAGTVTASSQPNITAVGALSTLSVTGNVTANYFLGNGSQLTGIVANTTYNNSNVAAFLPTYTGNITANNINITGVYTGNGSGLSQITGGNVVGTVANATYSLSANSATSAGTVTTAAQPNITSVGNLTSLTVTGNASAGNINTGILTATTITGTLSTAAQPNITSVGNLTTLTVTGNAATGNLSTTQLAATTISGTLSTAAQPNITSVGNLTSLTVTGNISGNVLFGNGSQLSDLPIANTLKNGSSNIKIFANGAVTIAANSVANVVQIRESGVTPGNYGMLVLDFLTVNGNITGINYVANGTITGVTTITAHAMITNNISSDDSSFVIVDDGLLVNGDVNADTVYASITKTAVVTVINLPAAATAGAGARSFVSDADSTTFGNLAVGGASNNMPVFSNGAAWYIG